MHFYTMTLVQYSFYQRSFYTQMKCNTKETSKEKMKKGIFSTKITPAKINKIIYRQQHHIVHTFQLSPHIIRSKTLCNNNRKRIQ